MTDSLVMAKQAYPGKRNNLNALCERYGISNAHRTLHGALLDSTLLAEVYLAMTRGQDGLMIEADAGAVQEQAIDEPQTPLATFVVRASADDEAAHAGVLTSIAKETRGAAVW